MDFKVGDRVRLVNLLKIESPIGYNPIYPKYYDIGTISSIDGGFGGDWCNIKVIWDDKKYIFNNYLAINLIKIEEGWFRKKLKEIKS